MLFVITCNCANARLRKKSWLLKLTLQYFFFHFISFGFVLRVCIREHLCTVFVQCSTVHNAYQMCLATNNNGSLLKWMVFVLQNASKIATNDNRPTKKNVAICALHDQNRISVHLADQQL